MLRVTLFAVLALAYAEEAAPEESPTDALPTIEVPATVDGAMFFEPFLPSWEKVWKVSKDADFSGRWKLESYAMGGEDTGLVVSDPARKHAVSTIFDKAFDPKGKGLVIQYELQLKNGLQCGGAYLKLLTASDALTEDGFKADTPYTIMFGPDRCGETNKVHFIMRHQNPISKEWEEKHLVSPPVPETNDKLTHLYTAVVGTDNTVKILVDNVEKKSASLLSESEFSPPINPPKTIDDPADKKPDDWVDDPKMDEPGAAKPDDWDEDAPVQIADPKSSKPETWLDDAPDMVADPTAEKPSDWDEDEDGAWEAPLIKNPDCEKFGCGEWKAPVINNPEYKGKWSAPKVDNPDYKGVWAPAKIDNPHYFTDDSPHAMAPVGGVGIEIWTMQDGILFDNIVLTHDASVASGLAAKTFVHRKTIEELKKKEESRKNALDGEEAKGMAGAIKKYALKAWYYAQDNPAIVVNTAKTAESTSERYYTLLWDSADVLGFEEKQARARLWRRTTQSGGVYERAYGEVDDSALLFLAFDYMHTRNNIASGVREIVTTTHKVSRAALGAKVARAAQLAPADAFSEPEWHAPLPAHPPGDEAGAEAPPDQLTLKAHFDVKFGLLWVLLRHLFFGADAPDLALPAAWCTQFKESASRKLHLSPEMIERALTPLSSAEFLAAGVGQLFVTGVSHGASLAQAFHMYFNRAKSMAGHPLKIYSVHYGAYRWTDAHGAALFRALTRGDEAGGKHAEAVAISASDGNTQGVVDPIPRINWRAGGCFQRRGYENVVDPVVIAADTGAVDVMAQGALQERRICCGALDAHFHMASTYRGAVKHLTHAAQSTSRARRESRQARGEAASFQASREKIKARLGALRTFVRKSRRPSVDENDIAPTIVKVDEPA